MLRDGRSPLDLSQFFCTSYHDDRAAFELAVADLAERTQRSLQLHRRWLEGQHDLCVLAAEFPARDPQRLLVLVTGIHGVEGYAGSAIVRYLTQALLASTAAENTGIVIVHALNAYGFANGTRVNGDNVDLNRNCAVADEPLFVADSSAYAALAPLLSPRGPAQLSRLARARFYAQLLALRMQHGERSLREASVGGQYIDPDGVFWGGDRVQPEIEFFQELYERLAGQYREVLLVDFHTGYGLRGEAYALFGRADSAAIQACTDQRVSDARGRDRTYAVRGDLVGYCYQTAKRSMPLGTCNGVALEIGTHALSITAQVADLYTVVLENQTRHYSSRTGSEDAQIRADFRELFYPIATDWRSRTVAIGARCVEGLMRARGFLATKRASCSNVWRERE
ncbi:MAG: hypothetical protein RL701_3547 [Pseudomonadota bacterium]|jgi:hypothetical protein